MAVIKKAIIQNGFTFTILSKTVFNFPDTRGNGSWKEVVIDATGITVEASYYN